MSDSAPRTNETAILSLETTNQTKKMENPEKEELAASNSAVFSYPGTQKRILIMISLYLAIFLVALVRELLTLQIGLLTRTQGPKYHIDSNPTNYG